MSNLELKQAIPCPFCGSMSLLQTDQVVNDLVAGALPAGPEQDTEEWFVTCGACGAIGPLAPTREEAVTAWNVRA